MKTLAIYGTGGHAREVLWTARRSGSVVKCFVIGRTTPADSGWLGLPYLRIEDLMDTQGEASATDDEIGGWFATPIHVAIGNPAARARAVKELEAQGFSFVTLVDPSALVGPTCQLGEGTYVGAHSVLTTEIVCGRHVQINVRCSVSHDCTLEDFVTMGPGVTICGNVHVKHGALLGAGSTISNGKPDKPIVIGEGAVVGAGAVVVRDVPPSETVVGVPARVLGKASPQTPATSW